MLKQLPPVTLPLILALSLAACSAPGLPEQLPFAEPGVKFTVEPSGAGCTSTGSYRGKVSWEVPGAITSKVEIQVRGQEVQIFARSDESVGSEETGDWVSEGKVFVLLDRTTDMVLAAIVAGPGQCGEVTDGKAGAAAEPADGE